MFDFGFAMEASPPYNYDYEADVSMARAAIKLDYQHHVSLLEKASLIEIDPFAFVHAGIHPDRSIHEQKPADCLTIRKPFLEYAAPFSHVVVHGHTITESRRPFVTRNRIAQDTGAYGTGHLTALVIDPHARSREFAWTTQTGTTIPHPQLPARTAARQPQNVQPRNLAIDVAS
ncbi:hypothetical protein V1284_001764 [Nitrobacteraceae bacterium AZCC 2299]